MKRIGILHLYFNVVKILMPEYNVYEYKQHQGLLSKAMFLAFIPTLIRLSRSQKNHKNINEWAVIQQKMQLCQKLVVWKNCKFKKVLLIHIELSSA